MPFLLCCSVHPVGVLGGHGGHDAETRAVALLVAAFARIGTTMCAGRGSLQDLLKHTSRLRKFSLLQLGHFQLALPGVVVTVAGAFLVAPFLEVSASVPLRFSARRASASCERYFMAACVRVRVRVRVCGVAVCAPAKLPWAHRGRQMRHVTPGQPGDGCACRCHGNKEARGHDTQPLVC